MLRFLVLFLFLLSTTAEAQKTPTYTDHKPQYRKWLDSYILDKIEYTKTNTIFYFRFVCDNENSGGATFYPPGGESPWYLKGRNVRKDFDITAVKNVRRNGTLVKKVVANDAFHSDPAGSTGHTIFSCEVHFERLPNDLEVADLIEGRGQEYNRRHFNCFNIKLKTWEDDLGSEDDSKKKVEEFENKYKPNDKKDKEEEKEDKEEEKPSVEEEKEDIYTNSEKIPLRKKEDIACEKIIVLDKVKFHDNSTKYKGMIAAKRTLGILFDYLREYPKATVTLYGHTDIFGDKERNLELSKARVVKIQRWLSMYGIKPRRIEYKWFGGEKPLVEEGHISNRRVEFEVHCKE